MPVSLWTIYDHPADYPDSFVVRRFEPDQPTNDVYVCQTLEQARALLPPGLFRLERASTDAPSILETWF